VAALFITIDIRKRACSQKTAGHQFKSIVAKVSKALVVSKNRSTLLPDLEIRFPGVRN